MDFRGDGGGVAPHGGAAVRGDTLAARVAPVVIGFLNDLHVFDATRVVYLWQIGGQIFGEVTRVKRGS